MTVLVRQVLRTLVASWITIGVIIAAGCQRSTATTTNGSEQARKMESPPGGGEAVPGESPRTPIQVAKDGFVSSRACEQCHREQHESWHRSYHRSMTRLASLETVEAPFDGRTLHRAGIDFQVLRRGEEFFVTATDPDREYFLVRNGEPKYMPKLPIVERPIVMVTGSHHMQIYWMPSTLGNELRIFPWVYSIDEKSWIPYEDSFVVPPNIGRLRVCWNNSCIACHSVNGNPKFDRQAGGFASEVAELGIACEACHGPGEPHIAYHQSQGERKGNDPIVNPSKCSPKTSAQICGQCHSSFDFKDDYFFNGPRYRAGDELTLTHQLIDFAERSGHKQHFQDTFWDDGTARIGGREYLGLRESKCFQGGEFSCLECHSMHQAAPNQQLKEDDDSNRSCIRCHEDIGSQLEQHTHHAAGSSGSQCYNCHMPRTSYALFRAIRSHRIDRPSVKTSVETGRPNACNLCHFDRSLAWTSKYLKQWYQTPEVVVEGEQAKISAASWWLLRGDAAQRIVAAWHMGWPAARQASGENWQAPLLAQLLDDSYAAVRFVASKSLKSLPGFVDLKYDFLANPELRSEARKAAVEQWRQSSDRGQPEAARLQTESGDLNQEIVDRLLREQNQRPVMLSE